MCGRYALYGPTSRRNRDTIEFLGRELVFPPTYNAAPARLLPVCRVTAARGRELALLRWGLVPFWAKSADIGARMINARCESVAEKPAFRAAFARRRCLVPMSGFYEWQRAAGRKVPHFIRLLDAEVFAAAGLYESWRAQGEAAPLETFTIITTEANEIVRPLHERMPVILHEADYEVWLSPERRDTGTLARLLAPYPAGNMRAYPVGTRVNNAANDGPELVSEQT
ncbi:MAG: SOS response-associated peptidase [Burkholderiales bacterium]|nr:SOS response-associated peptidase [Burkholderiales bacterium]